MLVDSKNPVQRSEMCTTIRYSGDEKGWAHAMQVMFRGGRLRGDDTREAAQRPALGVPNWDEDGIGIALPTTGTNHSNRLPERTRPFNTLAPMPTTGCAFDFWLPAEGAGSGNGVSHQSNIRE